MLSPSNNASFQKKNNSTMNSSQSSGENRRSSQESIPAQLNASINQSHSGTGDLNAHYFDMAQNTSFHHLTSVINAGPKQSKMKMFFGGMQKSIMESKVMNKVLRQKNDDHSAQKGPQISISDFNEYRLKIKKLLDDVERIRNIQIRRTTMLSTFNYNENLIICYKNIPKDYFEPAFQPSEIIKKIKKGDVFKIQVQLSDYLDEIELNLCYQITYKFQDFLGILLNLSLLENQIFKTQKLMHEQQCQNQHLKNKIVLPSRHLIQKKRRLENQRLLLKTIEVCKFISQLLPNLNALLSSLGYEKTSMIVKEQEEYYYKNMRAVKCLNKVESIFATAKSSIDKSLMSEFINKFLDHIMPHFYYVKPAHTNHSMINESCMLEESFLNTTILNNTMMMNDYEEYSKLIQDESAQEHTFNWYSAKVERNLDNEERLSKMILELLKIKTFHVKVLRTALNEQIIKHLINFFKDLIEYFNFNSTKNETPVLDGLATLEFNIYLKILMFFFKICQGGLQHAGYLVRAIIIHLINHYAGNPLPNQQIKDEAIISAINDIINELLSILEMIIKEGMMKFQEILEVKKVEDISLVRLSKILAYFKTVNKFFRIDFLNNMQIKEDQLKEPKISKQKIINEILPLYESTLKNKVSSILFDNLRKEYEKRYLKSFEKEKLDSIRLAIENEIWKSAEIPFEYNNIFKFIFLPNEEEQQYENYDAFEEYLKTGRSFMLTTDRLGLNLDDTERQDHQDSIIIKAEANEIKKPSEISILRNEVVIFGSRYQTTGSFLLVIKYTYDYLHLAAILDDCRMESLQSMNLMFRCYNQTSIGMTLGAGAKKLNKVEKITAKILALHALSLKFLLKIADNTVEYIALKLDLNNLQEAEKILKRTMSDTQNYIDEIYTKIVGILEANITDNTEKIKQLKWNDSGTKIIVPTQHTASIIANTSQMFKAIKEVVFREDLMKIFMKIATKIDEQYIKTLREAVIDTKVGSQRIRGEAEYFLSSIKEIQIFQELNIESLLNKINDLIQIHSKVIAETEQLASSP